MDEQENGNTENPGSWQGAGEASGEPNASGNHEGHGDSQVNPQNQNLETPAAAEASPASGDVISLEIKSQNLAKPNPLHVKLSVYDGPLDLLLELIKKNEMDIYNIQVAEITRQYLESLQQMKQLDLEVAGEFIVMAATLIWIKSKMLLPNETQDDDEDMGDPRAELVRRLLEYQAFKEAAKELGMLEDERGKIFTRQISDYYLAELEADDVEIDTFSANLFDLLSAFQGVLTRAGRVEMHEVFEQEISIEEKMEEIKTKLATQKKVVFSSLFGARWTRNLLIATFLSILEIVRTKYARVMQDEQFGEIVIEKIETALTAVESQGN